ncbi:serine/threonine-protein kinase [Actinophytocola sp.]|uniref:serine/threonine-protein kinase n=1 Tax=Actinophytocola sp. TaxID=1872138 RepID=UPI002ED5556F
MPEREGRLVAGRYRLRARLGSGGMGTVWRATDEFLERTVAIKEVTLLGDVDESAPAFQRTLREARTSARLRHPNIVTVHDVVLDDGRPWIVMELVEGPSLAEVVERDGPLPDDRAVDVARQLLAALAEIHEQGVLHRDVKPANVLLAEDRVVLTDFGIAAVEGATALTATNQLIGSPQYLAPERINGNGASQASDLWALGVTLYFLVTGDSPFQREDTQAVLAAVLTQEPPPVSGALGPLIAGLLRKDPAARLTAADAIALLQDTDRTRPITGEAPTRLVTPPDTPGSQRRGLVALAAVVILVVAVFAWVASNADDAENPSKPSNTDTAKTAGSAIARMADRGSVVVGVLDDQPGIGFFDSAADSFDGFDIQIAELVANKLGFAADKITFTPLDLGEREHAIVTGAVDMVVAAYPMNTENMKRVSFAGPYLVNALNLLVRASDPLDPNALGGHKVCTLGSFAPAYLEAIDFDKADIVAENSLPNCLDALSERRVDAVFSNDIALTGYAAARPDLYGVHPFSTATSIAYGIALGPDEKPLRDRVNAILTEALADGTWQQIYDRTLGASGMTPTIPTVERK